MYLLNQQAHNATTMKYWSSARSGGIVIEPAKQDAVTVDLA